MLSVQDPNFRPISPSSKYILVIGGTIGCLMLLTLGAAIVCVVLYFSFFAIYSEGSQKLADEWRDEMTTWKTPADATQDGFLSIFELADGEWAIVRSKSSHGGLLSGGGTMVVKDSNGMMNIFHRGHVCGDGNPLIEVNEFDDLASFYDELAHRDFSEFEVPKVH